jgi:hypothetical protein
VELSESTFLLIIAGYVLGGLISLPFALFGIGMRSAGERIFTGIVGLACLGYGGYLFFASTDSVWIFFYAMILPFLLVGRALLNTFKTRTS